MFGFHKKTQKEEPETMSHPEMGELSFIGFWKGSCTCNIFGNESLISLYVFVEDDSKYEMSIQENSYKYYYENMDFVNNVIVRELYAAYELDKSFDLQSRFQPSKLIIGQYGDCGLSFRDNSEIRGSSAAQVVVTILPNIEYFGSEDDYC